jgi:hypothetical protein
MRYVAIVSGVATKGVIVECYCRHNNESDENGNV